MNRPELKAVLQNQYDRSQWISTLQFLTGKREYLTVNLSPKSIEIDTQEAHRLVKSFHQIGTLKTFDGASLPIFEIILEDDIRIDYNRVGVNEFIKKFIIKDAIKGALATFSYDNHNEKTEWRFSFISKNSASDFFAEAEATETNPKKYTYIFGNKEEHRTAIERLYNLEQSRFRLEDFFEAFNVEPVSKKFFEEYKHLYHEFSSFIAAEPTYLNLFEDKEISDSKKRNDKAVKEVRSFVSRLLGRIVFLYFLQKKNWLGASSTEYKDGSTTFLSDLFFDDRDNQNDFYEKYLCPIFFEALNTDRASKKDVFKLENGEVICIPFLNGGLFEEEQEPKGHRDIKIPSHQFEMLFNFFNGFNFTVYENSPEEHTIAVDPEMLGHIFENLIDYNKDTGTFYTPKEIVQYMTQESLIEYLNTHFQNRHNDIEDIIRNQNANGFQDDELSKINQLLDDVKICDPAIGSGAFPMGMLQEIFNLKALINFKLGLKVWSPATVKQNIIQNSIYGVDLDEGAVEIARLRFWLSLVVDEGMPKALPNLDYKIMQGNSLLESFKGIDLSGISTGNDLKIVENLDKDLFGNFVEDQMKITVGKSGLAEEIQQLIKKYFTAKTEDKRKLKAKIESKITEHVEFNIELRERQLIRQILELGKASTPKLKKSLEQYQSDLEKLEITKAEIKKEQKKEDKNYFLWHLFFGDVLSKGGFDIVIGNPPYIEFKKIHANEKIEYSKYYKTAVRKYDVFGLFIELSSKILKEKGIHCYINPTTFLMKDFGSSIRELINNEFKIIEIFDFSDYQIFETAITYTGIFLFSKNPDDDFRFIYQKLNGKNIVENLNRLFKEKKSDKFKEFLSISNTDLGSDSWVFGNSTITEILKQLDSNPKLVDYTTYIFVGIQSGKDDVFFLKEKDIEKFQIEREILEPILKGKDVNKYKINWSGTFVIYPYYKDSNMPISESDLLISYPNAYSYLESKRNSLKGRTYFEKSNKKWYELWCERSFNKFKQKKIVNAEISPENRFQLDTEGFLGNTKVFSTVLKDEFKDYYYSLLGILNSKVLNFYHKKIASPKAGGFYDYKTQFIQKYPIKFSNDKFLIDNLVYIILFLKETNINYDDSIDNTQLSNFFEEVVDGLVFDLYFEEEMRSKNIYITDDVKTSLVKYNVEDNFEVLDDEKKKEIILSLYKDWSTGSVQIKMADYTTKSPGILKPILQS